MASNLLSRLLPTASDEAQATRPLNAPPRRSSSSTDGMDIDEENLGARFEPQDLDHLLAEASSSQMTSESTAFLPANNERAPPGINTANRAMAWRQPPAQVQPLDDDDDVPQSLLLEGGMDSPNAPRQQRAGGLPPPVPGPSTRQTRAQWETTRQRQRLHEEARRAAPPRTWGGAGRPGQFVVEPREKALWYWVNQTDLDAFLNEAYQYYKGCGIWSIILRNVLLLVQTAFVIGFLTFLGWCIDYSKLKGSHKMDDILVDKCLQNLHGFWKFILWAFCALWLYLLYRHGTAIPKLKSMHDFYHHLLDIPDADIQTVQWQQVVNKIMALRDQNLATASNISPQVRKLLDSKSRQRLDAIDIANRLMRRENYLIALFNKEILDVSVRIPFLGNRSFFSETTKWHVEFAIMDLVFSGPEGQFNQDFLRERNRRDLVKKLKTRLFWTGLLSVVWAPFSVCYVLASYLFKYFTEYTKDPSQLGTRDFTTYAQWKFREFNELPHLFLRRKNMAIPYANHYLAQFPKDKTQQFAAFVAFVTGAVSAILALFTLFDPDLFLDFEITSGRTALFYLGITTVGYQLARRSSPQEDQVSDPAYHMSHVIFHTRYQPASWEDRLHTDEVRAEFSRLYQPKIVIFAEEILSMVITPILLIFYLPDSSERIVDFFREFSIVVDGLGVVCSFSMFPFKKGEENTPANRVGGQREDAELREDYFMAKDNKMLASYYGFMDAYSGTTRPTGSRAPRGNFHPPPQFPNQFGQASQLTSPVEAAARGTSRGPPAGRQVPSRRTRSGPHDHQMHSTLLDPHHQPSASILRVPHGRFQQAPTRIEEESTIGESWRTSRLAQDDDEEEEEVLGGNRGGVLQLMQQFSKAQVKGQGAGGV
ncbi:autophagy protein-like protein Apg9 [Massarina eburnea CBS 473.64]|uniref:Autophagy-related protein 9 n=1 Tax=Massarina eburnea CBS 473.64 TaxID=1395130 RepID=A0A6A6RXF3_9PLEO|nr:autophagy protein-like protein Apg9 [Massarina eburnea CBS 473.64]